MSDKLLELGLRRQRLQLRSEQLRGDWIAHARGVAPALRTVDRVRAGGRWLRHHPEWVAGAGIAIAVVRPRATWRWLRRGIMAWQFWRNGRQWLDKLA